ncbi:Lactate utilization protein B [Candidatus Terasakiella magnetica]|uniref:Lactate utilization protein B n=1 Tax=Candidatus Terasakiella magnetica TaxID=1867952 RepID=A0A1C3RHT3_9PROT|nr:LutB/LldF family L-lactate oxidation iron-sulfur protein [Candidatus Terasakiella magnetica]SCA56843.1 Lactate utilization protein B [Candidatus Terasakiella magnetica]
MGIVNGKNFKERASKALQDQQLRGNFRKAMDGLMTKRAAQFENGDEWTRLRALGESIKKRALSKLPELLVQLEENLIKNGIKVHWAEDVDQANEIILGILNSHDVKTVVKGKSMVSEEMELNHFLGDHGIKALEADLGEYIVQMADEMPSHIIMPAIHMNKGQIAKLFTDKLHTEYSEDAAELTAIARKELRREFANAGAGLSGVNFAVAETGTLCLVENEGNGRMVTTVPPVHIAVTGIEKVVENLSDVPALLSLLTRSATGQPITTYFNMINSPRKEGEKDGPQEVHLVLLDNGRSDVYRDVETRDTLQCIRCGACMNHCPVYTRVGGHAYGGVYPGPVGKILTPQLEGLDQYPEHASASTLCNACVEVCPVKIPIAKMLVRLRDENSGNCPHGEHPVKGRGAKSSAVEHAGWKGWKAMNANPTTYKVATKAMSKMGNLMPSSLPMLSEWTSVRSKPKFAKQTLHDLVKKMDVKND